MCWVNWDPELDTPVPPSLLASGISLPAVGTQAPPAAAIRQGPPWVGEPVAVHFGM